MMSKMTLSSKYLIRNYQHLPSVGFWETLPIKIESKHLIYGSRITFQDNWSWSLGYNAQRKGERPQKYAPTRGQNWKGEKCPKLLVHMKTIQCWIYQMLKNNTCLKYQFLTNYLSSLTFEGFFFILKYEVALGPSNFSPPGGGGLVGLQPFTFGLIPFQTAS